MQLCVPCVTIRAQLHVPHVTTQEHSCVSHVWPDTQLRVPRVTTQARGYVLMCSRIFKIYPHFTSTGYNRK